MDREQNRELYLCKPPSRLNTNQILEILDADDFSDSSDDETHFSDSSDNTKKKGGKKVKVETTLSSKNVENQTESNLPETTNLNTTRHIIYSIPEDEKSNLKDNHFKDFTLIEWKNCEELYDTKKRKFIINIDDFPIEEVQMILTKYSRREKTRNRYIYN